MAFGRLERSNRPSPMSDINMTPLIDVMLVLLVIFMITAPLMSSSLKLDLPKTDGAQPNDAPQFISVALDARGQLFFGDEALEPAAFATRVLETARRNPRTEVQLRADQGVAYGRVAEVIGVVQKAGLSRIGFVTEGRRRQPALTLSAAAVLTIHNPLHHLHQGREEMFRGRLVPCHETAQRLDHVLAELQRRGLGPLRTPADDGAGLDAALARIHAPRYLHFLEHAWPEWVALDPSNAERDALPSVWPAPGMRFDVLPENFAARLGLFSFDAGTPLTAGTWLAARAGAACAVEAARAVSDGTARAAFALSRPPGHHAGADFFGGYCFLNNAALAAQALHDRGAQRVAVLDVDYHHGNGTQSIFYSRGDVLTVSIHGDPRTEYPFFIGHADERGAGAGIGFNLNLPLPRGTGFVRWREALRAGLDAVSAFGADALVVALGVDTFEGDPISGFHLRSADYLQVGRDLAAAGLPTVFVFEGGYAVAEVGINTANVLEGFGAA